MYWLNIPGADPAGLHLWVLRCNRRFDNFRMRFGLLPPLSSAQSLAGTFILNILSLLAAFQSRLVCQLLARSLVSERVRSNPGLSK